MIEKQLGFAILHQPRPRVLPRCRQLVRKRKRKSKPGKIYQRLLQSKAKQFWYQLPWYQQLWKNYEATTTIIATMTPRLMAAAIRKIGRRPTILKELILYFVFKCEKCGGWCYLRRNPAAMDESALTAPYKMRTRPTVWTPKAQVMKP